MISFINALIESALDMFPIPDKDADLVEVETAAHRYVGRSTHPHGRDEKLHEVRRDHISYRSELHWDSPEYAARGETFAQADIDDWLYGKTHSRELFLQDDADGYIDYEAKFYMSDYRLPDGTWDWEMMAEVEKAREYARPYIFPITAAQVKASNIFLDLCDVYYDDAVTLPEYTIKGLHEDLNLARRVQKLLLSL